MTIVARARRIAATRSICSEHEAVALIESMPHLYLGQAFLVKDDEPR